MKSLKYLNKYLYKYRFRLILGIIFVSVSNVFAILPALVIRHAFDMITESSNIYFLLDGFIYQTLFRENLAVAAFWFGLAIILFAVLKGIFMFFMRQTIIVMSRLIEYDLKNEIFSHYQKLNLTFYRKTNTGDLMARISEDVGRVRMYLGPAIMYSINIFILFVLVISTMVTVNQKLTMYVLIPLPLLAISIYYVSHIIEARSDRVQFQLSKLSIFVQEAFSGIRVLKTYVREDFAEKEFSRESEEYKSKSMSLAKVNAFFYPIMIMLVGLSTLLTIFVGGIEVISGRASYGNIAEFVYYVNMLTWPFASVGWVTSIIQRAAASQERINEFIFTPVDDDTVGYNREETELEGRIEFRNVFFTYPDSNVAALKNVSFVIEKGNSLAVLGKTGCGKSTIAYLLTKLYHPTGGSVLINNREISEIDTGYLRANIGYVPQDVFLFSDTISNNISFGLKSSEVTSAQIEKAAKDSAVLENILEFPKGLNTMIGERGITLSGGQKQRISIARAIIKSPGILIFDDCLSAVDTHTEEEILNNLKLVMENKTSLIMSHRVSSVKKAHQIIVLDKGEIVEEGTHDELLSRRGIYFDMYETQLLEEEVKN